MPAEQEVASSRASAHSDEVPDDGSLTGRVRREVCSSLLLGDALVRPVSLKELLEADSNWSSQLTCLQRS